MVQVKKVLAIAMMGLVFSASAHADLAIRYLTSAGNVPAYELAEALGYYEGAGIELKRVGVTPGGPADLMGLAGGSVDVANSATSAVLNAIASGNDFVGLFPNSGIDQRVKSVFYVLEDSPIKHIEDIAGKTVAVNIQGAHLDYVVREALYRAKLPQNAAKLIVVPGPQLEQVLRARQVDIAAFGFWQTTFEGAALKKGGLRPVFNDTEVLGDIAGSLIAARRDWVDAHPQEAKVFVEGAVRALDFAREHPEQAREVMARIFQRRGDNPQIAQYFSGYGTRPGGQLEARDLQFWIDILEREGRVKPDALDIARIIYTRSGAEH